MSCGVKSIRVSDEFGKFKELPLKNTLENEGFLDEETFKRVLETSVNNPGPIQDAIGEAVDKTLYEAIVKVMTGDWTEVSRVTDTVTITDSNSTATVEVKRITKVTFQKKIEELTDPLQITLNFNAWT